MRLPLASRALAAALIVGSALAAAPVVALEARNQMTVTPLSQDTFRVEYQYVDNETAYWCAAGDYVQRVLGLPGKTPIFRASPPPRKRGQGITFTLDPAKAGGPTGISSFGEGRDDNFIRAGFATGAYCSVPPRFPF